MKETSDFRGSLAETLERVVASGCGKYGVRPRDLLLVAPAKPPLPRRTPTRQLVKIRPAIDGHTWVEICQVLGADSAEERRQRWLALAREPRTDIGSACVCLVLADLQQQGWEMRLEQEAVWAIPPDAGVGSGHAEEAKARVRSGLLAARAAQLRDTAVRDFIAGMQARRAIEGRRVSVLNLVDDGRGLAAELRQISRLPLAQRVEALGRLVHPELSIVNANAICPVTGLPLLDVWRYFRHTWSLEYRPTPGRSVLFLIRNTARANAPVMAIGALANPTLQLRARDEWIGWSAEQQWRRASTEPAYWQRLRSAMLRTIEEALGQIRSDDLLAMAGPTGGEALEARLRLLAAEAKAAREREIEARGEALRRGEVIANLRDLPEDEHHNIAWDRAAQSPLFTHKRAKKLADLLLCRRKLLTLEGATPPDDEQTRRAFALAAREIRNVGLASRVLELNVCGAIPPYRELLAGKLAALAAASAELAAAYATRYAAKVSEIASQMAGREVVRSTDLCLIGTTSLFGAAASQYNRLKLDVSTPHRSYLVEWRDLGLTEGYGTVHLSEATVDALRRYSSLHPRGRRVNNLFGEGQSPRLRQVRESLDALGLDSDGILRHSASRRIYALELFEGARECLCLNEPSVRQQPVFERLAAAWRERWLVRRLDYCPALDRLAEQGPQYVAAELAAPSSPQLEFSWATSAIGPTAPPASLTPIPNGGPSMPKTSNPDLIYSLYRATAACADHHSPETIRALHIETALDDFIRVRARAGGLILVTGNPGDGKTHLLRHLEGDLRAVNVKILLDANEQSDEDLAKTLDEAARRKGRGLALAVNEGVLVNLLRAYRDRGWAAAARDQILNPFVFGNGAREVHSTVCVLDLNHRNNLSPAVTRGALARLLQLASPCVGCPEARCNLQRNAARLSQPRAAERLVRVLHEVSRTGIHATMRDLQGFLAFMLFGAETCSTTKAGARVSWYWQNAFEGGQGELFDAVRAMDPMRHTVALLDDILWRRADTPQGWQPPAVAEELPGEGLEQRFAAFVSRKRRAFFEHEQGDEILAAAGTALDHTLSEVMQETPAAVKRLVRLLNRFFDRDESQDRLFLWVTHRFDAQPNRYAACFSSIPVEGLEILLPKLRPEVADAFPDFHPRFSVLRRRGDDAALGLRVDRHLIAALLSAEQGLPSTFRRGEPEARIAAFYDRVSRACPRPADDVIEIRLVDMESARNHTVSVDLKQRRYVR